MTNRVEIKIKTKTYKTGNTLWRNQVSKCNKIQDFTRCLGNWKIFIYHGVKSAKQSFTSIGGNQIWYGTIFLEDSKIYPREIFKMCFKTELKTQNLNGKGWGFFRCVKVLRKSCDEMFTINPKWLKYVRRKWNDVLMWRIYIN